MQKIICENTKCHFRSIKSSMKDNFRLSMAFQFLKFCSQRLKTISNLSLSFFVNKTICHCPTLLSSLLISTKPEIIHKD
jgi:hypothetical protein